VHESVALVVAKSVQATMVDRGEQVEAPARPRLDLPGELAVDDRLEHRLGAAVGEPEDDALEETNAHRLSPGLRFLDRAVDY
jgi:hypothetical protein